ncbi:MAG: hypothetical protein ABEJ31_12180 [Haloarculaceae archaeon]
MADRETELSTFVARLREREAVADAWLAKSFTDRLLVVDLEPGAALADDLASELAERGFRGANEVYETGGPDRSFAGAVGDCTRHQFVDVETRGQHQSYVLE